MLIGAFVISGSTAQETLVGIPEAGGSKQLLYRAAVKTSRGHEAKCQENETLLKNTVCSFCRALRAATIFINRDFHFGGPCGRQKQPYLNGFAHREYARTISSEKSLPTH